MNPLRVQSVLKEVVRRSRQSTILDGAFPEQRRFLDDPNTLKAALCTRRAGKSYAIGLALFKEALARPGTSCLYVSLTREHARKTMHKDVLRVIAKNLGIECDFNKTTLEVTLPNGSIIYLLGADANKEESEKILGQKYSIAVVDEAASFRQDLRHLVMDVILPTLADYAGQLLLIGTPSNVHNWFFDVTTGLVPGWSVHKWTAHQNPHIEWKGFLRKLIEANPRVQETPQFRQHYLGEWVTDTTLLVYSGYSPANNDLYVQPNIDDFSLILSVDFGWGDSTALVLMGFSPHDPDLYILKATKRQHQDVTAVAEWIKRWAERYPIDIYIADTSSKQVVEELIARHGIPFQAAEKRGKSEAMLTLNSEFIQGRVKVLQPHCAALVEELTALVWDEDELPKRVEDPGCENHLLDSLLYGFRKAANYAHEPAPKRKIVYPQNEEEVQLLEDQEDEQIARLERQEWWERD